MKRIYLDTNILLTLWAPLDPLFQSCLKIRKTIEENESYTPELIETIKFELVDSLRIIKEKPHTKITRINTLNSKYSLKLDLQMIEKFLLETDNKDSEYYIKKNRNIGNILRKRIVETTV